MNTNSTELPVTCGIGVQGMFKKHYLKLVCIPICMYVFGVEIKRLSVALNHITQAKYLKKRLSKQDHATKQCLKKRAA